MGNHVEKLLLPHLWKEDEPDSQEPLKYDPQFGFKEPRKPKGKRQVPRQANNILSQYTDKNAQFFQISLQLRPLLK